jgi:hypothetical protein
VQLLDLQEEKDPSPADREALYRQSAERLPVGHVGEAAEIAAAYLYLMRLRPGRYWSLTAVPS